MSGGTNDSYTNDIAARGLRAIQERRAQQRYNRTNQRDALAALLSGDPYVGQGNPMYDAYLQAMHPQGYGMSFTRGGGKYNGWDTQGLMTTELKGTAEMQRAYDRQQAQILQDMVDQQLGDISSRYDDALAAIPRDFYETNTNPGSSGWQAGRAAARGDTVVADGTVRSGNVNDQRWADYAKALADWRDQASDQWLDAGDLASQIEGTPLRDYAFRAGAQLGIDPALIAGWYPESSQIGDFTQQRDLESLNAAGMPYSEYQNTLAQFDQQQQQYGDQQQQAMMDQAANEIQQRYGMDGNSLATTLQMTLPQLVNTLNSDNFITLDDEVQNRISNGGLKQSDLDDIVSAAAGDPATQRALLAIYTPYLTG